MGIGTLNILRIYGETSFNYVEYAKGSTYSPSSTGSIVAATRTVVDVHDLIFRDTAQEVQIVPGNRLISVKLNSADSLLVNLISVLPRQDLDITVQSTTTSPSGAGFPTTTLREWSFLSDTTYPSKWWLSGIPYKGIKNGVERLRLYDSVGNGLLLGTGFECTVLDETSITIEYTYQEVQGELHDTVYGINGKDPNDAGNFYMLFFFCIYFEYSGSKYFLCQDETTKKWYTQSWPKITWPGPRALQTKALGTNFSKDIDGYKISSSIDMGEVYESRTGSLGSYVFNNQGFLVTNEITNFNFVVMGEQLYKWIRGDIFKKGHWDARNLAPIAVYGDLHITTTNDLDFNLITGEINTNFLNKKELEFFIGDNTNLNYTNGILQGSALDQRTSTWTRSGMTEPLALIDIFFIEKFRMYNASKQQIISPVVQSALLHPFALYTNSKQSSKPFILAGYSVKPSQDTWEVTLLEYDNSTEVNLIDG